jgi:DNA-binding Lrp family transcriptional regulator
MPGVYTFYNRGIRGNVGVIVALKTLGQLNDIKDKFKSNFSILELKTSIWLDVKEMNENLSIVPSLSESLKGCPDVKKKLKDSNLVAIGEIDKKITDRLAENGRISMDSLGKEIGVSTETAKRRYEKLKRAGVLKVTIQINPSKLGYQALCVFFTSTSKEESNSIVDELSKIPNVISVMKTSGDFDLQIYSMVQDIGQLILIQEQIGKINGITKIELEILRFGEEWTKWPSPRQYISTF